MEAICGPCAPLQCRREDTLTISRVSCDNNVEECARLEVFIALLSEGRFQIDSQKVVPLYQSPAAAPYPIERGIKSHDLPPQLTKSKVVDVLVPNW